MKKNLENLGQSKIMDVLSKLNDPFKGIINLEKFASISSLEPTLKGFQALDHVKASNSIVNISNLSSNLESKLFNRAINYEAIDKFARVSSNTIKLAEHLSKFSKMVETIAVPQYEMQNVAINNFIHLPWANFAKSLNTSINYLSIANFDFLRVIEEEHQNVDIAIKESKNLKKIISQIYIDNSFLIEIPPRKFEEVIAELLHSKGFKVQLTKQTRDNGYDILAIQNLLGFPLKFLVECKRYGQNKPVGVEIIRSFMDVINQENANKGIIVTTSYFTKIAKDREKKQEYLLELKDRNDILDWVHEYLLKYGIYV